MASPPRFKAFSLESFPDAPDWFRSFLTPLNETLTSITNALSGRLSKENFVRQVKTLTIRTAAVVSDTWPIYYQNELVQKPYDVHVGHVRSDPPTVSISEAPAVLWDYTEDNRIKIKDIPCLDTANTLYYVTLISDA